MRLRAVGLNLLRLLNVQDPADLFLARPVACLEALSRETRCLHDYNTEYIDMTPIDRHDILLKE